MKEKRQNPSGFRTRFSYAVKRAKGIHIDTALNEYIPVLDEIRRFDLSTASDADLTGLAGNLRKQVLSGENGSPDGILPRAYSLVAEACRRVLGEDPFDVQIIAGIVMHQGNLAQMNTGEGKTLAAVFPAFLNGLAGKGVHIMTANDYLAKRDALWMGGVYRLLGLRCGYISEHSSNREKQEAYGCDITYVTAKQAGFDFLSDQLQYDPAGVVQRDFNMVIVDEADFILIDEARIPLVIAGSVDSRDIDPYRMDDIVHSLRDGTDYSVDRVGRNCHLTASGEKKAADLLGCEGAHDIQCRNLFAGLHVALHAHTLLTRDEDYIVKEGKIELVDEFTGRIADKRRWPYGIQTALEAKEGLELQQEGKIYGSITTQHFIGLYPKIAAMTATAVTAADEFSRFYDLGVIVIPPNRESRLSVLPDRIFTAKKAKYSALLQDLEDQHSAGRPVLVGTRTVQESQELADTIRALGIRCSVLNAKHDEEEAEIIARAGMTGAVTISTNMAGRGTDIKLGGEKGIRKEHIEELGGLYVIGTNRHESIRIDNQLRGRAGRQGDPGASRLYISLEDDLVRRYAIMDFIPDKYLQSDTDGEIRDPLVAKEIARAQSIIEDQHYVMRRTLRKYSELLEKQRKYVQSLRVRALKGRVVPGELMERLSGKIGSYRDQAIEERQQRILSLLFIYLLDTFWSGHLALSDELKEGIHLQRYGGKDPLLVYIREMSIAFSSGLEEVMKNTEEYVLRLDLEREGDLEEAGFNGPSSTWTYMINDNPFPNFSLALIASSNIGFGAFAGMFMGFLAPLFGVAKLVEFLKGQWNNRKQNIHGGESRQ